MSFVPMPATTCARSPTASTTARTTSAFSRSVVVGASPPVPLTTSPSCASRSTSVVARAAAASRSTRAVGAEGRHHRGEQPAERRRSHGPHPTEPGRRAGRRSAGRVPRAPVRAHNLLVGTPCRVCRCETVCRRAVWGSPPQDRGSASASEWNPRGGVGVVPPQDRLDHDQRVAVVDDVAVLHHDLDHRTRHLGEHRDLHLHRLQDDHRVVGRDLLAHLDLDLHHGRDELGDDGMAHGRQGIPTPTVPAATPPPVASAGPPPPYVRPRPAPIGCRRESLACCFRPCRQPR